MLHKEEYFNSAVLIPLILIEEEYHLLFEKRASNIRQGGEICFPGGEYDPELDSSFKQTAVRETCEELGINEKNIEVIGCLDTLVGPMGVTVDSFIGVINIPAEEFNIDHNEVEKVFLIPLSYFLVNEPEKYSVRVEVHPTDTDKEGNILVTLPVKELELPERYHSPWQIKNQKILVYKTSEGVVWGITAVLAYEVAMRIKRIL